MNTLPLKIVLPGGLEACLQFRQVQPGGDWICQARAEYIFDLQTLLEGGRVVATVQ